MAKTVATEELTFDDFHKDEYRAFQLEGESQCISIPTIRDRLLDMLVSIERQMAEGDHLSITLTVSRPSSAAQDMADAMLKQYAYSVGRFP